MYINLFFSWIRIFCVILQWQLTYVACTSCCCNHWLKQIYKISKNDRVVVTRLFSTKNKIASASPAIGANHCCRLDLIACILANCPLKNSFPPRKIPQSFLRNIFHVAIRHFFPVNIPRKIRKLLHVRWKHFVRLAKNKKKERK